MYRKQLSRRSFTAWAAAAAVPSLARSQDRSGGRTLRMIVPYAAGGPADAHARAVAESIKSQLNQPVIVDNRGGALTAIGHRLLSQAEPDGTTFGMLTVAAVVLPATTKGYQIDPLAGFTPIAQYNSGDYAIVSNPKVPVKTFAELVAYAQANRGKFNVGTGGGHLDLVMAALSEATGANWSIARYKGAGPTRLAVMSGEIDATIDTVGFAKQYAAAGKVNFLAVTGEQRTAEAPLVPTVSESVAKDFHATFWWGFAGPPRMPAETVATLNGAIRKAMTTPEVQSVLRQDGTRAAAGSPEEFAALIRSEYQRWSAVARKYNIVQDT